ncbi:Ig-like domain-containing protein [Nocardia sp. R6R-6]|uniref:Ig-like domain-containing protein n=1 Tax=Nocardia sp. R6R-6 TaxID=3459303 RepID=UPI00403DC7D1
MHTTAGDDNSASDSVAHSVQAIFNLADRDKGQGPFPSNRFTVHDNEQNTRRRVDLPKPECALRPSDCVDIDVINTLDGFNITPRISIPFDGEIDLSTVSSETVFLRKLGSTLSSQGSGSRIVGINQIEWDIATTTLHVTADDALDQHTRYALFVTAGVRDHNGKPIRSESFERFRHDVNFGQSGDSGLADYRKELLDALKALENSDTKPKDVVVASVFTTRSVTTELEKIRDQVNDAVAPVAFDVTTFPLDSVTNITFKLQTGTAPTFAQPISLMNLLQSTPGIGTIGFGKYVSPDYRNNDRVIPPTKTKSGAPTAFGSNEITFDLYLPSGAKPSGGWPVAIAGHGAAGHKQNSTPVTIAATLASKGIATIAINGPGNGGGPLSELTVTRSDGSTATILSGGRGQDTNGDGVIAPGEGASAAFFPIRDRDRVRQTAVDLLQLVRVIGTLDDVDASRIYYVGQSLGGLYGTVFVAVEPRVRAAVLNVTFPFLGTLLSPTRGRPAAGAALAARTPSLINSPGIASIDGVAVGGSPANYFNENLPLRDQPPVTNTIAGAIAIQEVFDHTEWVQQSGGAFAYAARLSDRPILLQVAKGDQQAPNPLSTAVIRAGDFAETTTFYRHDLAVARNPGLPKDPHDFLNQTLGSTAGGLPGGAQGSIARAAQQQIADFLASDGQIITDPDGPDTLFEVPIPLPLPETTSFIA